MYDHTFYKQVQISRSDIRPHIKWAVSLVILHMVTSIFLWALCGYIWVNILTLSPRGGYLLFELDSFCNDTCALFSSMYMMCHHHQFCQLTLKSASHGNWVTGTVLIRIITELCEGMRDAEPAKCEPALLPPLHA